MQCSICDKPMYGHPPAKGGPVTCGSCGLTPLDSEKYPSKKSKSIGDIRLGLVKLVAKTISKNQKIETGDMLIKSNFARNTVVLLDGKFPLTFNKDGEAFCPAFQLDALQKLITAKPGRFWIVETAPVAQEIELEEKIEVPVLVKRPMPKSPGRPKKKV